MKSSPRILLIAPPFLYAEHGAFADLFNGAGEKSKSFPVLCEKLAKKYGCDYLDMSLHIKMSEIDGLHIDESNQFLFVGLISEKVKQCL